MSDNMASSLRRRLEGRKLTSKIIGYLLLGAIGLVFVFFGVSNKMGGISIGSVARVNDTLISLADFQNEENRVQQYYSNLFGGQMDLSAQRNLLKQQALEDLIRAELTSQAARHNGIVATDAEVRDFIVNRIPVFQDAGQFQRDRYMGYLQSSRSTAGEFENRVRKEIESERARRLIDAALPKTILEEQRAKELQDQKMDVAFARVSSADLAKTLKVPAAEVQAKLADPAFVKKAEEYFKAYQTEWSSPAMVKVQHLLITAKAGDAAAEKVALEKISKLKERSKKEDLGTLAAQFSEDPGSKAKKGIMEPFTRGRMVKEFEDVAFSAKPGEISAPVKSPFGYHLIKVLERKEAKDPKFEDVKVEVATRVLARDRAEDQMKGLDAAVAGGDLAKTDEVLKSLGVSWEETGYFGLGAETVPKLPSGPVADAAFEVSAQKPLLNRVIHDTNARYILKFKGLKTETGAVADASRPRSDSVFGSWVNQFREASHVNVNQEIFKQ